MWLMLARLVLSSWVPASFPKSAPGNGRRIVQIVKTGPRLADITGHDRQQAARPHDIATGRLALEPLAEPQQGRARAVQLGGLLDQGCGHAGVVLSPGRCTRFELGQQFLAAKGCGGR